MPPIPSPRVPFRPPEEKSGHSVQGESQGVDAQCPGRRWVSAEQTGGGHSAGIGSEGLLPLGSKQVLTSESPPFQAWDHEEQVASGLRAIMRARGRLARCAGLGPPAGRACQLPRPLLAPWGSCDLTLESRPAWQSAPLVQVCLRPTGGPWQCVLGRGIAAE